MSDIPIDPELLKNNPALNFITQLNNATDPTTLNADDFDDDELTADLGARLLDLQPSTSASHPREHFGCLVKSHMNLSNQAEGALNGFCANSSAEECEILMYAKLLQLEDMGHDAKKVEASQGLSDELKKNIHMFTHAFVLSPNITAYCGNCADNVLIDESMAVDSLTRNIAELAQAILKKTTVPPTLQLYIHLAVVRWHFLKYPDLVCDDDFWQQVDETLEVWRTACKDKATLTAAFNGIYSEDKNKFGNPASTKHQPTDLKNVPDWIVAVNNHASKVLGGQVKKKKGKGLKRKRNDAGKQHKNL
ncbi:hypothetical protein L208DRAFT_1380339 [Tricholoma matsutake]|nr:hypothetical protein L208DRAFT_1380339 [Tricholoma matsutake 945]